MQSVQVYEAATAPAPLTVAEMRNQINTIHNLMSQVLRKGEHYGEIPGTRRNPDDPPKYALLKSGAEKIAMAFRLAPRYEVTMREYDGGHREYEVRVTMYSAVSGLVLGEGLGCCTTMEGKYRYRTENTGRSVPPDYWKTKNQDLLGGCEFIPRKSGESWKIFHREEQGNPADYYNTVLKMAKKRAMVDAVLTVTAASDIFAPDEDGTDYAPPADTTHDTSGRTASPSGKTISEAQGKRLFAIAKESGRDLEQLQEYLNIRFGIGHSRDIPSADYDSVIAWVKSEDGR